VWTPDGGKGAFWIREFLAALSLTTVLARIMHNAG